MGSIIDNSVIKFDEVIDMTKSALTRTFPRKTVPTKSTSTNFYTLLAFLLTTIG